MVGTVEDNLGLQKIVRNILTLELIKNITIYASVHQVHVFRVVILKWPHDFRFKKKKSLKAFRELSFLPGGGPSVCGWGHNFFGWSKG